LTIWTIGFAQRSAEGFFGALRAAGIRRLVDVRLHNTSQLAGFTKARDLPLFLREICGAEYVHEPLLAPDDAIFKFVKKQGGDWNEYARRFKGLLAERRVEQRIDRALFNVPAVLLCTEPDAARCHRGLVLEYLNERWGGIEPAHI
jgi:uncharacterized protein (DUF488 family)